MRGCCRKGDILDDDGVGDGMLQQPGKVFSADDVQQGKCIKMGAGDGPGVEEQPKQDRGEGVLQFAPVT